MVKIKFSGKVPIISSFERNTKISIRRLDLSMLGMISILYLSRRILHFLRNLF